MSASVSKWTFNAWVWQSNNACKLLSPLRKYSKTPALARKYRYLQVKVMASVRLKEEKMRCFTLSLHDLLKDWHYTAACTRARSVAGTMLASLLLKGSKDYRSRTEALLVCCQSSLPKRRGNLSAPFFSSTVKAY